MTDDKAAELLAAVRAVESGEASAASFFTESAQQQTTRQQTEQRTPPQGRTGARQPAPAAPPGGGTGAAREPAAVPGELREVLAAGGAPETLAPRVAETLGAQAVELLRTDPWQLLAVPGVRPEQADGFARALLDSGPGDERRAEALVVWLLERAALAGHTALEPAALAKGLSQYAVPEPDEAVRTAIDAGAVLVFEDALDARPLGGRTAPAPGGTRSGADGDEEQGEAEETPVRLLLGLDRYALAEESLADGLTRIVSAAAHGSAADGRPGPAPQEWEAAADAAASPSAAELIRAVAGHGLVAHSGGEA
ncbi:helix-hairpin-helix domain-containing protein, partial [Streptomyces nanshensis]